MTDSIFTKIIKGEIPTNKIYEDDKVIAILDVHPLTPGHTLVIPKKQIEQLWDVDDETYNYLWKISKMIAKHILEVLKPSRVGVIVEGFGVSHAHIHLVPINYPEELKKKQDLNGPINQVELKKIADRLRIN